MHFTEIRHTPDGNLPICETCGDRPPQFMGYGEALAWCDKHESKAKHGLLDPRTRPSLTSLERLYRQRSELTVYTPTEREQWRTLADEVAEELARRTPGPIEGQMALFE